MTIRIARDGRGHGRGYSAGMAADRYVTETAVVAEVVDRARAAGRVALDTEFLWERTYVPKICLTQLAVQDEVFLIDPLGGAGLEPIAELIADDAVVKVMHAPAADLLAFGLQYGARPRRVFDTQLAAGFVGLTATASLDRLLSDALRVRTDHHESFSDWSQRPLSDTQLAYAGDDVRHLEALADELTRRLAQRERTDWAVEELSRRIPDGADVVPDPGEAWRKVQRRSRLKPQQVGVLRELAAWREREARRRDIPASWVMKDATLVELARVQPPSLEAARKVRGIGGNLGERDFNGLRAAITAGRESPPPAPPAQVPASVARRADAASGLAATLLRVRCADHDIASELVATRGDLERYVESVIVGNPEEEALGRGWRADLVGREIADLVAGRVAMSLSAEKPYLVIRRVES